MKSSDSYRGISVLSPFSKLFEKVLASQIKIHFETNNIFSTAQHGFRRNRSCETALHSILDNWKQLIDKSEIVLSCFIDFRKAFDYVDPELLLQLVLNYKNELALKLFHYGFDNNSIRL